MANKFLVLSLVFFSLAAFFVAQASSTSEYQQNIASAKAEFNSLLQAAQARFDTRVSAAETMLNDTLEEANRQRQNNQIKEENYDAMIERARLEYDKEFTDAENELTTARKNALNHYRAERRYAYDKFILNKNVTAPTAPKLPTSPPPAPLSPIIPPGAQGSSPVSVPANTPVFNLYDDWYVELASNRLQLSCSKKPMYTLINVPDELTNFHMMLAGWHYLKAVRDGRQMANDVRNLSVKMVYVPTGKVMFDNQGQGTDILLRTNAYKTEICDPTKIACEPNVERIPAGQYLVSVDFSSVEPYCDPDYLGHVGEATYQNSVFAWTIQYQRPIGSGSNLSASNTPSNTTVKTLTPQVSMSRFEIVCGSMSGESLAAGETKYYKFDMTKWIDWQRKYFEAYKNIGVEGLYQTCLSLGKNQLDGYNARLTNGTCDSATKEIDPDWCKANATLCFQMTFAQGSSESCTQPDANYAQTCAQQKSGRIADANAQLAAKETLYAGGNYATSLLDGYIGVGCDPYTNENAKNGNWGCERARDWSNSISFPIKAALGFNQSPDYGKITQYANAIVSWANRLNPPSASSPVVAYEGTIDFPHVVGSGLSPFVVPYFNSSIQGADNIYLMAHNGGTESLNFIIEGRCPDGVAK